MQLLVVPGLALPASSMSRADSNVSFRASASEVDVYDDVEGVASEATTFTHSFIPDQHPRELR